MPRSGVIKTKSSGSTIIKKSRSLSGASDGVINPGSLAGQTRTIGSPAGSPGHKTRRPTNRRGKLPSLLRGRFQEPDLPGHMEAPRPSAPGQSRAMTQDVRSKNAAPPDRRAGQDRPRAGPKTPALLILRQEVSQQDSLTRGQRRSRGPHDTTGGGVHRRCSPSP